MPAAITLSDAVLAPLRPILETRHTAVTDHRRRPRDVLQRKQAMSGRLLRASVGSTDAAKDVVARVARIDEAESDSPADRRRGRRVWGDRVGIGDPRRSAGQPPVLHQVEAQLVVSDAPSIAGGRNRHRHSDQMCLKTSDASVITARPHSTRLALIVFSFGNVFSCSRVRRTRSEKRPRAHSSPVSA